MILFWFVCGKEPWHGASMPQMLSGQLARTIEPREGCPPVLLDVCIKCLALEAKDRPQDGVDLVKLLLPEVASLPGFLLGDRASASSDAASSSKDATQNSVDVTEYIDDEAWESEYSYSPNV